MSCIYGKINCRWGTPPYLGGSKVTGRKYTLFFSDNRVVGEGESRVGILFQNSYNLQHIMVEMI